MSISTQTAETGSLIANSKQIGSKDKNYFINTAEYDENDSREVLVVSKDPKSQDKPQTLNVISDIYLNGNNNENIFVITLIIKY